MKILFSFFLSLLMFSGCMSTPKPVNPKPVWINNHGTGAIGICDTHIRGNAVQEEVAMDRALKKLAKAKSSTVKTSSVSTQHEDAVRYGSSHDSVTEVSANATVSARIEKSWRNPRNNRYYVWMIPN